MFFDPINRADVGVVQRSCSFGFLEKTCSLSFVCREMIGQEFQCNNAVKFGVLGFVDDAHAAFAELFE